MGFRGLGLSGVLACGFRAQGLAASGLSERQDVGARELWGS